MKRESGENPEQTRCCNSFLFCKRKEENRENTQYPLFDEEWEGFVVYKLESEDLPKFIYS